MEERVIMAGFGGQGLMTIGQLLAYAGLEEDKNVSWMPSYGPEQRGGTANCHVIVSDGPVGSPVISEATGVIVMNRPSLEKFESYLIQGGVLVIDSTLIDVKASRTDVEAIYVPADEMANEMGNSKMANMIMLGAYVQKTGVVKLESLFNALRHVWGNTAKERFVEPNIEAIKKGAGLIGELVK
ncbi:2-oxoacid:acceptor oxidoreductase family protein [Calorimonas adulescens]|jgi:Pyruvate ferredoxin/flavodoxin oxidoreductase.|uniref:2-oxoacid:ferredoxin oxidoreductase subunit gamma n=1 Tax=Calorimonas adulescens TaxID=2606906 RepID=A0A5D8QB16_9THEO|nr:2-oxoacid:acceptor oxidoreductase family protein [Calorimonas adulescens]MDI6600481.1 2-oxoacid:acceptor oxidoreductase family protein [Thermoanaerobacteraceae bacterium]TZE81324.1 2-oxoacid:ferredoxin oxidoreductase subunit gamma [Calorimonas adulescens]